MAIEQDKIKDLFSSKLGNFEPDVPASVWGGLDQLLSNQPVQAPDAGSSSSTSSTASAATKTSLLKTIAITVGLTAAITAGIFVLNRDKQPVIVEQKPITTKTIEEPKAEEVIEEAPTITEFIPQKSFIVVADIQVQKDIEEEKIEPEVKKEVEPEKDAVVTRKERNVVPEIFIAEIPKFFTKDISFGLTADFGLFNDNISERGGLMLFSRNVRSKAFLDALAQESSSFTLEHRQPISLEFSLSKNVTPRLSIETGLVYTYLSSKLTSNSIYNIEETQSFNYLGIPLSINYTFYELGKTKFYLSAGGMIQKDIGGRYESNVDFSKPTIGDQTSTNKFFYQEPYYIKKTIKQSNPQFSVRTRLGIAYPLYKKLYLYGTIGGAYYFDAGNEYRTIYSDKKTQLDLNLGVKYDF